MGDFSERNREVIQVYFDIKLMLKKEKLVMELF
jgi:hypothetical protein